MSVSGTNLDACQEAVRSSDAELVEKHKLVLITGYRLRDEVRGSAAKRAGDTPLRVLVAEVHAFLGDRRKRAEEGWEMWGDGAWQEAGAYRSIRRRMTDHIRNSSREARLLQTKRRIDNPGKLLDKEGPWFDWVEAWVKTGWATMDGGNCMPLRASEIHGQQTRHACTPWAWSVSAGLQFFWWRTHAFRKRINRWCVSSGLPYA